MSEITINNTITKAITITSSPLRSPLNYILRNLTITAIDNFATNINNTTPDNSTGVVEKEAFYRGYPDDNSDPCLLDNPKQFSDCKQPSHILYYEPDVLKQFYMCCLVIEVENYELENAYTKTSPILQYYYKKNINKSVCKAFNKDFNATNGILPINNTFSYIVDCGKTEKLDKIDFFDNSYCGKGLFAQSVDDCINYNNEFSDPVYKEANKTCCYVNYDIGKNNTGKICLVADQNFNETTSAYNIFSAINTNITCVINNETIFRMLSHFHIRFSVLFLIISLLVII